MVSIGAVDHNRNQMRIFSSQLSVARKHKNEEQKIQNGADTQKNNSFIEMVGWKYINIRAMQIGIKPEIQTPVHKGEVKCQNVNQVRNTDISS